MKTTKQTAGAIVLGMHDALVSLTGMIGGLTVSLVNRHTIILTAIIASVAAGLSMGASCYLAEKTNKNPHAIHAGIMTSGAYLGTCGLLILPFFLIANTYRALMASFGMSVLIILGCNWCIRRAHNRPWWRHALEMLIICATVSVIAFLIGEYAQRFIGITI